MVTTVTRHRFHGIVSPLACRRHPAQWWIFRVERWKTTRKDDVVRDGEKIEREEVAGATLER